jgi:predicted Rossmann fold nucleotide-binding protein DprA/Smf involved in DNA uptake
MLRIAQKKLALFCSIKCPGELILKTYDLAKALRDCGVVVISGFHSPMEQECLNILLKGQQPVVLCPARGVETMRLRPEWKTPIQQGRLRLLSPFPADCKRMTRQTAEKRNRFVADTADAVFVSYAVPGGKTEALCRQLLTEGKPLYTFASPATDNLTSAGAIGIQLIDEIKTIWAKNTLTVIPRYHQITIESAELIELKRHAHQIPECPGLDKRIQKYKGDKPFVCTKHELDWLVAVLDAVLNDPEGYPAIEHDPWRLVYVSKSDERWETCKRLYDRLKDESERCFRENLS